MASNETVLGLDERDMAALLHPLCPPGVDIESTRALVELFARVAFSALIEPGDTDASGLVHTLGARRALWWVARSDDAETLRRRLIEAEPSEPVPSLGRLQRALDRWRERLRSESPEHVFRRAAHLGARMIVPDTPLWPNGLDDLDVGRPLALWVRGDPLHLAALSRSVSVVGSRSATGYGTHVALESAAGLSDRGFALVSGGALGIDAAIHRSALASDQLTVAFLAGGVDRLYPAGNSELLGRIVQRGLVVAELPPGSAPTRWRFLMRNRLIAATSQATVVIEAGRRSGSLNTAGHAAQLGRPLGAVPGPVTSPASAGCHRLIREYHATCVTTAAEMAELADPFAVSASDAGSDPLDERVLSELVTSSGCTRDDLATRTGAASSDVAAALGRLELAGAVVEAADGWRLIR